MRSCERIVTRGSGLGVTFCVCPTGPPYSASTGSVSSSYRVVHTGLNRLYLLEPNSGWRGVGESAQLSDEGRSCRANSVQAVSWVLEIVTH